MTFTSDEVEMLYKTLGKVIFDGLTQYREHLNMNSWPAGMTQAEWNEKLESMQFAFQEVSHNCEHDPLFVFCAKTDSTDVPLGVLKDSKKYHQAVQKGLELFGKYFRDLWI